MGWRTRGHFSSLIEEEEKKQRKKIASDWELAKWIISYLREAKIQVIGAIILILLGALIALVSPQIIKFIVDEILNNEIRTTADKLNMLLWLSITLLMVAAVTAVVNYLRMYLLYDIGFRTVKKIRTDSFKHLQELSMKYIDKQETGRLISKISNDCDKINELMSGGIITSLTDFATLIGIMIILLVMNWQLALMCFALSIPATLIISYYFRIRARRAYRRTRKTIANVTANLSESISGVKVSKTFNQEGKNIEQFRTVNYENRDANIKAIAVFATTFPLFLFISSLVTGFVYLYSGYSIIFGGIFLEISIGTAIAFTQYVGNFFRPVLNLTMVYNTFQSIMAATERVYELNHAESDVVEKEDAIEMPKIKGQVTFKDVVFGYEEDELVLNGFNLKVKPGESIAIVGPTGAGKTTIINLLARFYEIQEGAITIDGYDVQDVTLHSLHKQMGIVLQDPFLFTGTIAENITYRHQEVDKEKIIDSAAAVNAHEFVTRLPDGYETEVGERGGKLSLGQRQLISFARALLPDPRILILDEATSSVDPYTELLIKEALDKLLEGRTSFIIAHRLSTVRNADRIIVIEDGKIVEEGNNEELLAKKGEYYRLYQLQFKSQEEAEQEIS
jgi:ABC-type multidrug transport system fused ATPase/permease subunit